MIRVYELRIVDEDGSQLGVMRTGDALRLAQERGLDLVEVAPLASPPVARLLDFGQYKYELTKREKEAKRKQRSITFKEVRLKPKIGIGDFDTKVRRAIEFLEDGDRVKIAVQFRGRELTHPQIGRDLLDKFAEKIKEHGVVERPPLLEGKSMHISVASTHKPKSHEPTPQAPVKGHAHGTDEATASETPTEAAPVVEAIVAPAPQAPAELAPVAQVPATETPAVAAPVAAAPVKATPVRAPRAQAAKVAAKPVPAEIEEAPKPSVAKPAKTASRAPSRKAGPASTGE
jgi:translation initiation factor IF-3